MQLHFLRHGEAEAAGAGQTDAERRLTPHGEAQTRRVLEALARAGIRPERIISSPLVRARQTADLAREILAVPAEVEATLPPETRVGDVQRLAEEGGERLLFVGHAPHLAVVVAHLTGGAVELSTSGLARVDTKGVAPGQGRLVWLLSPEVLP